ncbi:uncharacterized protein DUF4124 [Halospina denitrificans]|uniref:Uncharacterized protein DUF4124 n=1 Tax=Halospina denitrificans TaxID=332522 RepID=A0A4R7K0B3_9GAMM|nr:DUF4124 domain-containing protein [Halospina denitrificans]TDT44201.1 uncharacterized protein DUF4124 [Halospina denitrificans]
MASRLLLMAVLTVFVSPLSAEIYQWKDDQGNVHFSDEPPPDSEAETQEVTPDTSAINTDSDAVKQRKAKQRQYLDERQQEREQQARERAEQEQEQAQQEARCREMRGRIKHMERMSRFYVINDDGSRSYVSEEEAQRVRARRKRQYEEACG